MYSEKEASLLSPRLLAYVGDGIYELKAREYCLAKGIRKLHLVHQKTINMVNANAQAQALEKLKNNLNDKEQDIVRRGRNANTGQVPNNAEIFDYRLSTGLEALFGYLYLSGNKNRLEELWLEISANFD
ncbi:Mini-ribonuclease 3 [Natronospora cellulosivora (SeqCode)]